MVARVIGPLSTQVRSVYDRVVALWGPLLLAEEKPLTFMRSMMDQLQLVPGLRQINRNSILPRVKALMGLASTTCPDPIGYLTEIGSLYFISGGRNNLGRLLSSGPVFIRTSGIIQELVLTNSWRPGLIFITYGTNPRRISSPESTR